MKKTLLILISIIGLFSCSDSDSEQQLFNGILVGEFIEITPESNRTTLIFSSNSNQLQEKRINDGGNSVRRTFSIRLLDNGMIELSSNEVDEELPRVFHYQIISNDRFEIGNINEDDSDEIIMVFQRN